jgi:hypothetical protein
VKKEKGGGKAPSLKLKMELSKIKQPLNIERRYTPSVVDARRQSRGTLPFGFIGVRKPVS